MHRIKIAHFAVLCATLALTRANGIGGDDDDGGGSARMRRARARTPPVSQEDRDVLARVDRMTQNRRGKSKKSLVLSKCSHATMLLNIRVGLSMQGWR